MRPRARRRRPRGGGGRCTSCRYERRIFGHYQPATGRQCGRAQTARLHRHHHVTSLHLNRNPHPQNPSHGHCTHATYTCLSRVSCLQNAIADENQLLSGAESQQAEVRVAFGDNQAAASDDQQTAAQTNSASIDEITLDDADDSEENRNKRFVFLITNSLCYIKHLL